MALYTSRLLTVAIVFVLLTIGAGVFFSYKSMSKHALKREELNFMGSKGWSWFDEKRRVQIKRVEGDLPALRKVYADENYAALLTISDNGRYRGFVFFDEPCEEGSAITETKYYGADGEQNIDVLHCIQGKLVFMKSWATPPETRWEGNVGDFRFSVSLEDWDLKPLQKAYYKSRAVLI